jgi:hypothetical protein
MVFSEDLHWDRDTHELRVTQHGESDAIDRVATENGLIPVTKEAVYKVENAV